LGERLNGIQEVASSILVSSTTEKALIPPKIGPWGEPSGLRIPRGRWAITPQSVDFANFVG
jgi:hypothetical protein